MRKLVLIGGGGHCKSVIDAVLRAKIYSEVVITDPVILEGTTILTCKVVGNDDKLPELINDGFTDAFITVGSIESAELRKKLFMKSFVLGFNFPVIADPSAVISKNSVIGKGTFIGKNAVINADVKIGANCIINTGCIIEHECVIGDFTHISVGSILCGNVEIGNENFIGAGSTVIQGLKIGNKNIIGANSVVLSNMEDNMKVYGIIKITPPPELIL